MASAQPSTPHTNPKGTVSSHGSPMGSKKVPSPSKKAPSPIPDTQQEADEGREGPRSPMPGEFDGDDDDVKEKPKELDEAIDLGDEPQEEGNEKGNEEGNEEEDEEEKKVEGEGTEGNWQPEEDGTEKSEVAGTEKPEEYGTEKFEDEAGTEIPDEAGTEAGTEKPEEAGTEIPEEAGTEIPDEAGTEAGTEIPEDGLENPEEADVEKPGGEELEKPKGEELEKPEGAELEKPEGEELEKPEGAELEKPEGEELEGEELEKPEGEQLEKPEGEELEKPEGEELEKPEGEQLEKPEGEEAEKPEGEEEQEAEPKNFAILEGKKVNKGGWVVDEKGNPVGKLIEGDAKKLAGKPVDAEGNIWNDSGKVIGKAEPLPDTEREEASTAPFEDFTDAVVDASGKILFENRKIGIVVEGNPKVLAGKKVDPDGDILDKHGNVIGKAIREDEEEPEPEPEEEPEKIDCSSLAGLRVNKAGNVINDNGRLVGRVVQGALKALVNKTVDAEGNIHSDVGKVIGRAEPIPEDEKEEQVETPFEDFPGAVVEKSGNVVHEGKVIGKVIEGDAKKLAGKTVDPEGDIVDKNGTVLGKAERWEEEEVPEEVVDKSILAGKRVNKAGNVVDSSGTIYGRLVEGDVKALAGKMCDKQGFVRNESGDVVGKAELVSEGDREGLKTGPFADFPGCTVTKDGKITCDQGVVGRLIEGDANKLFGKAVDEDGDVLDKNGNVVGKAERWEEEEVKKDVNPMSGLKVNKAGDVYDADGELIGKLTEGTLSRCAGFKIDDDGDVVDQKGNSIGHVSLIQDIPEPEAEPEPEPEPEVETEPEETEEEKTERLKAEEDKKLAISMASTISQSLDRIKPVLKMITDVIEKAEAQPKEDLDEQKVVDEVKPLIEEGGRILTETNGAIRGLDPDGRIAENAKGKAAAREATPEEYRLADLLKELTGTVTQTIDNAKKKIAGMPHAKKELNPLWGLLSEPLFQILAAVGLLLSGVLGLVSQLLNGLGLGGLVRGLLGGLGITRVLDGLGLGKILSPLTGSKKK